MKNNPLHVVLWPLPRFSLVVQRRATGTGAVTFFCKLGQLSHDLNRFYAIRWSNSTVYWKLKKKKEKEKKTLERNVARNLHCGSLPKNSVSKLGSTFSRSTNSTNSSLNNTRTREDGCFFSITRETEQWRKKLRVRSIEQIRSWWEATANWAELGERRTRKTGTTMEAVVVVAAVATFWMYQEGSTKLPRRYRRLSERAPSLRVNLIIARSRWGLFDAAWILGCSSVASWSMDYSRLWENWKISLLEYLEDIDFCFSRFLIVFAKIAWRFLFNHEQIMIND